MKLNKYQLEAVKTVLGPVRIIAGPGSGKTTTLVSKVQYLLEHHQINPNKILIITFTNKAVQEIKDRINNALDQKINNVFTFHGLGAYFLRFEAKRIGISSSYRIIDTSDQVKIIKEQIDKYLKDHELEIDVDAKALARLFDALNNNVQDENLGKSPDDNYKEIILPLFQKYNEFKMSEHLLDFNDLLNKCYEILRDFPEVRELWRKRYQYFFVDEFQDTNDVQYKIIKLLTNRDSNITVVGDPDQNIYSWRGAKIDFILNFDKDYENVQTIILNYNYRSTDKIVTLANNLIAHNKNRISFANETKRVARLDPKLIIGENKFDEARKVIKEILNLRKYQNVGVDEIAIIYRNNFTSREFESALIQQGINYVLIGGFKFFERKEIKETINYLRFTLNQDNFSLKQIMNVPTRGVGAKTIEKLESEALKHNRTLWETLCLLTSSPNKSLIRVSEKLKNFIILSKKYLDILAKHKINSGFFEQFRNYLNEIGFIDWYKDSERQENINGFFEQLFFGVDNNSWKSKDDLLNYFNYLVLLSANDLKQLKNHLTLLTIHAAKGTEFGYVFLVGFNENVIPSRFSIINTSANDDEKYIEEERRVAYVGVTRAINNLYISYSKDNFNKDSNEPSDF